MGYGGTHLEILKFERIREEHQSFKAATAIGTGAMYFKKP